MPIPPSGPFVPTSPPHRGPRVEQRAILARTRSAIAARWRMLRSQDQEIALRAGFSKIAMVSVPPAFATQQMHPARVSSNYLTPSRHPCEGRDPVTAPPPDCCEALNARAFVRLRRPSYLSLAWPRARQERARTARPARRAEGRMPGVKRSNQQRRPPRFALAGHPCPASP